VAENEGLLEFLWLLEFLRDCIYGIYSSKFCLVILSTCHFTNPDIFVRGKEQGWTRRWSLFR